MFKKAELNNTASKGKLKVNSGRKKANVRQNGGILKWIILILLST